MKNGQISIPIAITISLVGSVLVGASSYFQTLSNQAVANTRLEASIEAKKIKDLEQDGRIDKVIDNLNIMNENISTLMKHNGLMAKPLKI